MSLDSKVAEFSFGWNIERFSQNMNLNLFSKWWSSNKVFGNSEWCLEINHPVHSLDRKYISIYLRRDYEESEITYTVDFTITIEAADVSFNVSKRMTSRTFHDGAYCGFDKFMSFDNMFANRNLYLPRDSLKIQCYMVRKIEIEDSTIVGDAEAALKNYSKINDLSNDLLRLHLGEKFCDVKVNAEDRTFQVHKALLCARSPVFKAMFDSASDTTESRRGIVDITDLDSDTVSRMLKFVYSDQIDIEEMDQDQVANLYGASDKYEILPLKERCSTFLKTLFLSEVNVCNVFSLADMHQDDNLKAAAQNYIFTYAHKILKSSEWNNFMKLNPRLSAEIMHKICIKHLDD